jgi:type IV fimbrial biogenesis protein FimT
MAHSKGFTLIELLVTIAIVAVLAAVAGPSLSGFVDSTRLSSAATLLLGDLNRARSEAIKRNQRVLVCVSNATGSDCASSSTTWASGWLVCVDSDSNGSCDTGTATEPNPFVLRAASSGGLVISTATASSSVRFNPDGTFTGNQPFTLIKGTSGTQKQVKVTGVGNISVQ